MEGVALFSSSAAKVFAGLLSDFFPKSALIAMGTSVSALVKLVFALSSRRDDALTVEAATRTTLAAQKPASDRR